ncbi:MAG: DUF3473 domain-containing protein [Candidatus Omnitrophica bacterium]|nr:DUF3473 domain-containing protein [Candidatus Omnitrophota bacterium]
MKNLISVDLEDWYTSAYLKNYVYKGSCSPRIIEAAEPILELFAKRKIRATFFILGSIAEHNTGLIKRIAGSGHEIASHGYSHTPLWKLSPASFKEEIVRTSDILEGISGARPVGFRAPCASIDQSTSWAIDILEEEGFHYDSSIFPMRTPLYGVNKAPVAPYAVASGDILKKDAKAKIIEIPFSIMRLGLFSIPCTGGFYGRIIPYPALHYLLRTVNKSRPVNFYFHPWETYPDIPRIRAPLFNRFVSYFNTKQYLSKIDRLLGSFDFITFEEFIKTEYGKTPEYA